MYDRLLKNIIFPITEQLIRLPTLELLRDAEEDQWRQPEDIRQIQWERLKQLLQHAYENVPFYHELFNQHQIKPDSIQNLEDFTAKIPFISKDDIRQNLSIERNLRN